MVFFSLAFFRHRNVKLLQLCFFLFFRQELMIWFEIHHKMALKRQKIPINKSASIMRMYRLILTESPLQLGLFLFLKKKISYSREMA